MLKLKKNKAYIKEFFKRADMLLFTLSCICAIMGIILVASATRSTDEQMKDIIVQSTAFLIGIVLFVVFTVIDIDIIADKWIFLLIFSILFMASLRIWGEDDGWGNRAWLRFGPVGVQPTEVVKYIFIVLLAKQITYLKSYKNLSSPFSVMQLGAHLLLMFGVIMWSAQDMGSALLFLVSFVVMLFMAGLSIYWFILGIAAVAVVGPYVFNNFLGGYQQDRIRVLYDATVDPAGQGVRFQTNQSKLSLASGQLTGTGLFNGPQTGSRAVPESQTDFIFAVAGEELGMIGCSIIIILLLAIAGRCIYVGIKSKNTMNMLICVGIGSNLIFQTFENVGMCIGLTPVIGLVLPFFSYGGSAMFSVFAAMGIVSGIKYRPKPEKFRSYG